MENNIQISKLNDFIFCPRSLFLHSIYDNFYQSLYHQSPQVKGKIAHNSIDKNIYSSASRYLQAIDVYSEKYGLIGKIDIYDLKEKSLIERKNKIKKIYDGYKYQVYAQYFCLKEMGYNVKNIFIHSLSDNKRYPILLPDKNEKRKFIKLLDKIKNFNIMSFDIMKKNKSKCNKCIYKELC